jgi:hypothetical protein
LISEPSFPSRERRFFCWRPRDKGPEKTKGEKNEKQEQEVLKRNLQLFELKKERKQWLRGE